MINQLKHLIYLNGKPAYKVETNELENALIKEVTKIAEQKRNTILKQWKIQRQ